MESNPNSSDPLLFNPEMMVESAGAWKILYRPKASMYFRIAGLMPIAELRLI
jgi:hypothetical protein